MKARSLFPFAFFTLLGACREADTVPASTEPPAGTGTAHPAIEPNTELLMEGNPNSGTHPGSRLLEVIDPGATPLRNEPQIEGVTNAPAFRGLMRGGIPTDLEERIQVKP